MDRGKKIDEMLGLRGFTAHESLFHHMEEQGWRITKVRKKTIFFEREEPEYRTLSMDFRPDKKTGTLQIIIPADLREFAANESLFAVMAASGWHLTKLRSNFTYFEEGTPESAVYRMIMITEVFYDARERLKKSLKEKGLLLVANDGDYFVFKENDYNHDPETEVWIAQVNQELVQKMVRSCIWVICKPILFALLYLGLPIKMLIDAYTRSSIGIIRATEITLFAYAVLIFIIFLIQYVYAVIFALKKIRMLKKELPPRKKKAAKRTRVFMLVLSRFLGVLFLLAFFDGYLPARKLPEDIPLSKPVFNVPEIENMPGLEREDRSFWLFAKTDNKIKTGWSPLIPKKYEVNQRYSVEEQTNPGSRYAKTFYTPTFDTQYYKTSFYTYAVCRDLVRVAEDNHRFGEGTAEEAEELEDSRFNAIYIMPSDSPVDLGFTLIAQRGKQVIFLHYDGRVPAEKMIDEIDKLFTRLEP